MALHCPNSLVAMAGFFDGISPEKLETLGDVYSPAVRFKDPLHEVHGIAELRAVYERILKRLEGLDITVNDAHGDDATGFLYWSMRYRLAGKDWKIDGSSHFEFAPDGRVARQRNHWDASFAVYGEFPLLGWAMRRIKRRVAGESH